MTDARAAAFLADPALRRFLEPFLARECTVTRAAAELGADPDAVLYRVRRLVALGLVRVAREEPRAGRALRVYRSTADAFFVPYALTPAADLAETMARETAPFEAALRRALARVMRDAAGGRGWGLLLTRTGDAVQVRDALRPDEVWNGLGPDDEAVLDHTLDLGPLSHARAKALQRDLLDVVARHARAAGEEDPAGGARRYLLRLALAPRDEG